MQGGWIKLHRKIMDNWIYDFKNPALFMDWLDLLMMANHEPRKLNIKGQVVAVNAGQLWTSIRKLSVRWAIEENTVLRRLSLLQSDGMIYRDSRPGMGTLITVHNYGIYQGFSDTDEYTDEYIDEYTDEDKSRTLAKTLTNDKQEYKNYKKGIRKKEKDGLAPDDPDYFEEV